LDNWFCCCWSWDISICGLTRWFRGDGCWWSEWIKSLVLTVLPELKRISRRFGGDGGGGGSTGGIEKEFCLFRTDDKFLFSWIELIVRARTEPGEKSDGSTTSKDDEGGRTISPLKRRVRKDGDVSLLFLLFVSWVLIDNDSNVDIDWFVSVAEFVRLRGEVFLREETNRLSSVIVCFNEINSSSK